jgi:hypothetical protein
MCRRISICFLVLLLFAKTMTAQSRFGIFAGGGTTWYYGDMNDRLLTHPRLFRSYFNAGLLYQISPRFDVVGTYINGKITGADSLAIQEFNNKRNLHFTSKIWEASLRLDYKLGAIANRKNRRKVIPYVFAGVGYFHHNPQAEIANTTVDLQPLGTEGQFINGGGYPKPYKLYQLSVPIGIGVEVAITRAFALRVELSNHFSFTDYLDDVSSDYADSSKLIASPNGALAFEMASNLNRNYPDEGFGRGNPKNNDTFMLFGASLIYRPAMGNGGGSNKNGRGTGGQGARKKKKKGNCPAFD